MNIISQLKTARSLHENGYTEAAFDALADAVELLSSAFLDHCADSESVAVDTQPVAVGTCATCKFWREPKALQGRSACLRYPPAVFYPLTNWCGEYAPKDGDK